MILRAAATLTAGVALVSATGCGAGINRDPNILSQPPYEGRGKDASHEDVFTELKRQAAVMRINGLYKIELQRYDHAGDALHATAVAIRYVP